MTEYEVVPSAWGTAFQQIVTAKSYLKEGPEYPRFGVTEWDR
jgi:hypothetical protein